MSGFNFFFLYTQEFGPEPIVYNREGDARNAAEDLSALAAYRGHPVCIFQYTFQQVDAKLIATIEQ